jgi:hypothetical protein
MVQAPGCVLTPLCCAPFLQVARNRSDEVMCSHCAPRFVAAQHLFYRMDVSVMLVLLVAEASGGR